MQSEKPVRRVTSVVRVLYNLALLSDQKTFEKLGARVFAEIWQYAETHGYDFNDEEF